MTDISWELRSIESVLGEAIHFKAFHAVNLNLAAKENGDIAYVTRTAVNNGIESFIDSKYIDSDYINKSKAITFGAESGKFFFHDYEFVTGNKMYGFYNENINKKNAPAVIAILKNGLKDSGFEYGYGMIPSRVNKRKISFPIINDEVAWDFLEKICQDNIQQFSKFVKESKVLLGNSIDLNSRLWTGFQVDKIFNVTSGKDFPKYKRTIGTMPFIGSTAKNNGLTDFIETNIETPNSFGKKVISVNRNGSVGYAFYHPYEAYFSGDTRFLSFIEDREISPYIGIFVARAIISQKNQFGFGFKLGTKRLKELKIQLPITLDSTVKNPVPDWVFIEDYIKSLPYGDLI